MARLDSSVVARARQRCKYERKFFKEANRGYKVVCVIDYFKKGNFDLDDFIQSHHKK